jgi:hypothetical protein
MQSVDRITSKYENPTFNYYYSIFDSSACAVTLWNNLDVPRSNSEIMIDMGEFSKLITKLRSLTVRPEDELKILDAELARLRSSTDQEDQTLLADIESTEDF